MAYCSRCGHKLSPGATICVECRAKTDSVSHFDWEKEAHFKSSRIRDRIVSIRQILPAVGIFIAVIYIGLLVIASKNAKQLEETRRTESQSVTASANPATQVPGTPTVAPARQSAQPSATAKPQKTAKPTTIIPSPELQLAAGTIYQARSEESDEEKDQSESLESEIEPEADHEEETMPSITELVLYNRYASDSPCTLHISNRTKDTYFLTTIDKYEMEVMHIIVPAESDISVSSPKGTYHISYAMGETWIDESELFGPDTQFGSLNKISLDFGAEEAIIIESN